MMSKPRIAVIGLLLATLLAASYYFLRTDKHRSELISLYGNIDIRQVELSFHDPEHIEQITVQEGERVKRGQLLAVQALERFQFSLDQAAARLDVQQHLLEKLQHGSRKQEIGKAGDDVKSAEASLILAKQELARMQSLAAKKFTSTESLDKAQAQHDMAKGALQALKEQYSLAAVGPRSEDIQAAEAQLKADSAAWELAKKSWEDAHLYAPQDGIVQSRILEPGDMATPQTPVLTLALIDPVWARTYVAETELGKLRQGLPAQIGSDSYPGKSYQGWVGYISPTAEFTPKTVETSELRTSLVYQVRIYVCNPEDQLRLGMPVTVSIDPRQAPLTKPACQTAQ